MLRRMSSVGLVLAALLVFSLVTLAQPATPPGSNATPAATPGLTPGPTPANGSGQTAPIRIMTFNIWIGGEQVDLTQVVEAIRLSDADVVGLQEAEGRLPQIAGRLGWSYVDERQHVISRFPLIDPPGADGAYLFVQPRPGAIFAIANVHLPSDPYGPEAVRDGAALDEVLTIEQDTRLPLLQPRLDALAPVLAAGIPTFFTGDFNAPSATDWTEATMANRDAVRFPVAWPTSTAMMAAGFTDSYRAAHPDPVAQPGLTWTPGYPNPLLRPNETFDRIDFVWSAGAATVTSSQIVGEAGGPDVDVALSPFAAATDRAVTVGDPLTVRFHAAGAEGERIVLIPAGAPLEDVLFSLAPRETFIDGSVTFGTGTLSAGRYDAALVSTSDEIVSRSSFEIMAPGAVPIVMAPADPVPAGSTVAISVANAPGSRWDWVAIYAEGDPDLLNYLTYAYTGAVISGTVELDSTGLEPGTYTVRLLHDDGYELLAETTLTIVP